MIAAGNINPPRAQVNRAEASLTQLVSGDLATVALPIDLPLRLVMLRADWLFPAPASYSIPLLLQLRLAGQTVLSIPADRKSPDTTPGPRAGGNALSFVSAFGAGFGAPFHIIAGVSLAARGGGKPINCIADQAALYCPEQPFISGAGTFLIELAVNSFN
jgi:hypothetical protein